MSSPRALARDVKDVIDTDLTDLQIFLDTAHNLVEDKLSGKGLSFTRLKDIEIWLAAHLVAIRESKHMRVEEQIGQARVRVSDNTFSGNNLGMTRWGQTALSLDTTGTLAAMGKVSARFTVL